MQVSWVRYRGWLCISLPQGPAVSIKSLVMAMAFSECRSVECVINHITIIITYDGWLCLSPLAKSLVISNCNLNRNFQRFSTALCTTWLLDFRPSENHLFCKSQFCKSQYGFKAVAWDSSQRYIHERYMRVCVHCIHIYSEWIYYISCAGIYVAMWINPAALSGMMVMHTDNMCVGVYTCVCVVWTYVHA